MCLCLHGGGSQIWCQWRRLRRSEVSDPLGAGVTGSCKSPDVMPGTELGSSRRAVRILSHWGLSSCPVYIFFTRYERQKKARLRNWGGRSVNNWLLCKLEELSLYPQHPHKKLVMRADTDNPSAEGAHGQPVLPSYWVQVRETPCLKE